MSLLLTGRHAAQIIFHQLFVKLPSKNIFKNLIKTEIKHRESTEQS